MHKLNIPNMRSEKMSFVFKRVMIPIALLIVEIFMFILFLMSYTKILRVNWDTSNLIYMLIGMGILSVITLFIFLKNKKNIENVRQSKTFVKATLTDKKQIGMFHRKIIIWSYEFIVDNKKFNKTYWNFVEVRKIDIGDYFYLAIDSGNDYFPLIQNEDYLESDG